MKSLWPDDAVWHLGSTIIMLWHVNTFSITGPLWRESNCHNWFFSHTGQWSRDLMIPLWLALTSYCTKSQVKWLGAGKVTSHYLNQWWPSPLMPHGSTRWQYVKKYPEPGVGLRSQYPSFLYFSTFSPLSEHMLAIKYHIYIWQVQAQLSCNDTCQIWMWFKESSRCFSKNKNIAYGEIKQWSFSNPHPSQVLTNYHNAILHC